MARTESKMGRGEENAEIESQEEDLHKIIAKSHSKKTYTKGPFQKGQTQAAGSSHHNKPTNLCPRRQNHSKCFNFAWIFSPQREVQAFEENGKWLPPNVRESS
jgi:hypothetical protein